jgi:hypothetical protein
MSDRIDLSIIIVSYNVKDHLLACLGSITATCRDIAHEIIVVDNNSNDGLPEATKEKHPEIKLIANKENRGFAAANNQGYEIAVGEYILLLNPDTAVKPGAVRTVLEFMKQTPDAGLAACRLLNDDGSLQRSVKRLPSITGNLMQALFLDRLFFPEYRNSFYYRSRPFRIGYPSGAFMMVRREALKGSPPLNENYFMYSEEKDLAWRLNQDGYGCYFVPGAEVIHYGGKSTDQMAEAMFLELQKSQIKYIDTYYAGLKNISMHWSYWLLLLTHFAASIFSIFTKYGRYRLRLMRLALASYTNYLLTIYEKYNN